MQRLAESDHMTRQDNREERPEIVLKEIGLIHNSVDEPEYIEWKNVVSEIHLHDEYREGLANLADYSHVAVLFWMNQVCLTKLRHVPQGRLGDVPEVGIFACRCPHRPNPIGVTMVQILDINAHVITVKGLDATNGTPVLDVKPYTPQYDFVCYSKPELRTLVCDEVRFPEWIHRLVY